MDQQRPNQPGLTGKAQEEAETAKEQERALQPLDQTAPLSQEQLQARDESIRRLVQQALEEM